MRKLIMLIVGVAAIHFIINWPSLNQMLSGYTDYIFALALSALIAPFIAPLWD